MQRKPQALLARISQRSNSAALMQLFCGTDAAAQTTATKAAQATAAQPHVCVIPESKR